MTCGEVLVIICGDGGGRSEGWVNKGRDKVDREERGMCEGEGGTIRRECRRKWREAER